MLSCSEGVHTPSTRRGSLAVGVIVWGRSSRRARLRRAMLWLAIELVSNCSSRPSWVSACSTSSLVATPAWKRARASRKLTKEARTDSWPIRT